MNLIDTHCHLDDEVFVGNVAQQIQSAQKVGVQKFIVPGVHPKGWEQLVHLKNQFPEIYIAPGVHPLFLNSLFFQETMDSLEKTLTHSKVVGIGEFGLDFYHGTADKDRQQRFFEAQVALAITAQIPALLHVRKAHDTVLATLRRFRYGQRGKGGVIHAFGGSLQQAKQYQQLGFCIGIGGQISYPRAKKIKKTVAAMPEETLLLETDAPYMPLYGHQGKANTPSKLLLVLQHLAQLRQENIHVTANYAIKNTKMIFSLIKE